MEYTLVTDSNKDYMIEEVNNRLHHGWELYGNHSVTRGQHSTVYAQAMIRTPKQNVKVREPKIPTVLPETNKGRGW